MDDKGRVSLPTEFRRVLDAVGSSGALYVVPQLDDARALVFFTIEAYSALIERHNQREYPSLAAQQRMELKLVTRASQIQVDDAGRIVLTKALRDLIGLEKELRFVGVASSFEVWRPDARDAFEAELMLAEADEPVHIDRRGLH
jgi:MraZ protein